jgi:hypothetical protein
LQFPPLEVIHLQPELHLLQEETLRSGLIRLKVYGVEKTLVDGFRHRRRHGLEPVLEILKDAINQRRLNVDELWSQAQCMQLVMSPCLEALLCIRTRPRRTELVWLSWTAPIVSL